MAHFDRSKWYQISTAGGGLSFVGTPASLTDNKTAVQPYGAVFLRISDKTDHEQQWQIYNTNSTHAVLRTRASGADNYLSAAIAASDDGEVTAGSTKPIMGNYSLLDDSMYWSIGAWSDRLFWFENAQNGSNWHLNQTGAFFLMSLNITAPQVGQQFKFTTLGDIDNEKYSTYSTPGAAATATASSTATGAAATSTFSSASSSSSSSSSSLSAGAKAAIGAVIGGAFLLGLVLALVWCLKRRKRRRCVAEIAVDLDKDGKLMHENHMPELPAPVAPQQQGEKYSELPATTGAGAKHQDQKYSELPASSPPFETGNQQIAELDGEGSWR